VKKWQRMCRRRRGADLGARPDEVLGNARIPRAAAAASIGTNAADFRRADETNGTMDLAHAIAAGGLAARRTDRRFTTTEEEIRAAELRVLERRMAAVAASGRREYTQGGRHAAPRPVRA